MANIRKADLANHIGEVKDKSLDALYSDLVVGKLVRNVSDLAAQQNAYAKSDVVKFPKRGAVTATDKASGTASTPTRYTDSLAATLTLNKHKEVVTLVDDFASVFSDPNALEGYLLDGAHAVAEAIESDIIALVADASRSFAYRDATGYTPTRIAEVKKNTRGDKWMGNKPFNAVISPRAEEDLLTNTTIVNHNTLNGVSEDALVRAKLGMIHGFDHYVSNLMPDVVGSPGYELSMLFQPDAIAYAFADMTMGGAPEIYKNTPGAEVEAMTMTDDSGQPVYSMRVIGQYSALERGNIIVVDAIYGVVTVRPELLYAVEV